MIKSRLVSTLLFALVYCAGSARTLPLHPARSSNLDLAIRGRLQGIAEGQTVYVSWADLRALPTARIRLDGEFVAGPQELTVLFLSDLWKALPTDPGADVLLAGCSDGYASVYTSEFISRYRPFLVLEINGHGPADWPPAGLKFNPGPYAITVSKDLVPSVADYPDVGHKKPWGVAMIEIASYADRFRGIYSGRWASLSPAAAAGRQIWVNSCASCHSGPRNTFGGTKAARPFQVIAAYAAFDPAFFIRYVRDPRSLVASATMEPHPHYTDAEMAELIGFLSQGG